MTSATHASTSRVALFGTSSFRSRRLRRALFALLASSALTLAALGFSSAPAQAWTNGACTTSNGVTVVVDFAGLGGGTTVRCAPGAQSSGVSALKNAGFSVGFVQQNSSQGLFVCRINGKPDPAAESCATTPPANASWSYWNAKRGGSWQYSNAGAGNRTPPAGTVEGWRFNNGRPVPPSVAPPAALPAPKPTHKPTAQPTNKPTRKPTGSIAGGGTNPSGGTSNAPTKAASGNQKSSASDSAKSPAAASATALAASDAANAADQQAAAQDSAAANPAKPQSPGGAIAALVAVVLIGGGAAFLWARRSRDT